MARRMGSAVVEQALGRWREVRAEFEDYRLACYARAVDECNGRLLNRRGRKAGIEDYSLFMGPESRAAAYASEELLEHWRNFDRPVFARYERQFAFSDWLSQGSERAE